MKQTTYCSDMGSNDYRVMMFIDGLLVPSSACCCGTLEKCQRALTHLQGMVDCHPSVEWKILLCENYKEVSK